MAIQEQKSTDIAINGEMARAKTEQGYTSLMAAVKKKDINLIKALLDQGAPINYQDSTKRTALHYACMESEGGIIDCLLKRGADLNVHDSYGRSMLAWARYTHIGLELLWSGLVARGNEKLRADTAVLVELYNMLECNHYAYE